MARSLRIIPEQCTGCMQCELACSFVQTGMFQPARSLIRVNIFDEQASYAPYTCFQCDDAWCMTACPVNAITIDEHTHAKVVAASTCVGCALCVLACPFGTIFYTPETNTAAKCDLCAGNPACVAACPTNAIEFVEHGGTDWIGEWAETINTAYLDAIRRDIRHDGRMDGRGAAH